MKKPADRFLFKASDLAFPDCGTCIHASRDMHTCPAYPNGIPEEISTGETTHRTVRPDQVGTTVYTKRP